MENGTVLSNCASRGASPARNMTNGEVERHVSVPRGLSPLTGSNSPRVRKSVFRGRKLVLHFDVRNTILVADSIDNISVEQALNSFLTGVTWGRDTTNGWEWVSDSPSLTAPHPNTMTYYKHLEARVVKVPSDRVMLRRLTGDFTQQDIGRKFASHFHTHLKELEWNYHQTRSSDMLTMQGKDGKLYHYILPAFYKLIHHLNKTNRDFCIIIRTYGLDAHNVCRSIKLTMEGKHPQFLDPLPISVNTESGTVRRKDGCICVEVPGQDSSNSSVLKDERTIYNYMSDSTGICAFVDDFRYWQDNGYNHTCAKPLWVDPSQRNVHHIFFDDNIRVSDTDSIVDVRVFDSASARKARSLSQRDAAKFENTCLVQANLLESTSNVDYFIESLARCEKHYDSFLKSVSNS